jgi:uncharacterized protein (DUF885 family)
LLVLSREHHTALSLSVRIARIADAEAEAALLIRVPAVFDAELEPHFQEEEQGLLPALVAAGELALVSRTLAEHGAMRNLMTHIRSGDVVSLKLFGQQLAAHVRFEERELFATAQDVLSADYLNQTR